MSLESEAQDVASKTLLSRLYADDAPDAVLLAEYPSSNSDQTRFRNTDRYIIHDPFPPPRPELLTCLGPHHLMFGWGDALGVTSQAEPPKMLVDHWCQLLGASARPKWLEFDELVDRQFIVLFPHQSLIAERQLVHPEVNYFLHSKQVIEAIDCPQAEVFPAAKFPCIAKLSHGYAGLGNYFLRNSDDESRMQELLKQRWPNVKLVYNSIIENINGDFGVQFYLKRDGTIVWLGFTQQKFDSAGKWSGGSYSHDHQSIMKPVFADMIGSVGKYLAAQGYFGVVGIDILQNDLDELFLVDVNPRLTGITPFLMASRAFAADSALVEGEYRASCRYPGRLNSLLENAGRFSDAKVVVQSAFDDEKAGETICHLSVTADSQETCSVIFEQLLNPSNVDATRHG